MDRDQDNDKKVEQERYNRDASGFLRTPNIVLKPDGARSVPIQLRQPYSVYENLIRDKVRPGCRVLDVCCGSGIYSVVGAISGAHVTAMDIATANLEIVKLRARRAGVDIEVVTADAEHLPFPENSFDVLTIANSLSYMQVEQFMSEVSRVLKPDGHFIFVDSLNHNPIYRMNRYIHYLRGHRTYSTLVRMPSRRTLCFLEALLVDFSIKHFGILSFLSPLLTPITGSERTACLLDRFDKIAPRCLHSMAFKVVGAGRLR